jgi:hypothetical protein
MTQITVAALAALLLASCSGGGNATPATTATDNPRTIANPAPSPTATATLQPGATPTASPSPAVFILKTIGGAPLTATAAQLSSTRRTAQAHIQAQGIENGLPILVESSGMVGEWAGDFVVWASNITNGQDIPETSGTITATNGIVINDPSFSQACVGSVAAACIVHPTGWQFGTSSAIAKPIGKQTLTITYGDGTTGTTNDYVYDGWQLPCNTGWAYVGGVPVAQATKATSDVYADCVNQNMDFPHGAMLLANPSQDQYGRYETIFPTLTAAPVIIALSAVIPMSSFSQGIVFALQTGDGGYAKVLFTSGAGVPGDPNGIAALGLSLHSQTNGSFAY